MALPTVFTSGDVFTAANANLLRSNQYNKTTSTKTANYVLVAADVGTRVLMNAAGSTTITVNTSLFSAGDTLEISNIGAGVCTVTSGTCTVTSSSNLALAQYVSGTLFFTSASAAIFIASAVTATPGALTFITGATFTTQTTVSLPANTFSATYSNYMIMFYSTTATAVSDVSIRFRAAGADNTTSNYIYSIVGFGSGGGTNNTSSNGTTSFATAGMNTAYITSAMFTIQEPQTANKSVILGSINGNGNTSTVLNLTRHMSGLFNATTSFDSLSFIGTDTMTGSYKVYGYSNS